jgi:RNA polymerase sigma-70 factor (ECF subfamily)
MRGTVRFRDDGALHLEIERPAAREARDEDPGVSPEHAMGEIVQHVAALRRYALLLVGDPADADDLVQESLLRVVAQARAWRPMRDVRAYVFATLHNVFIDSRRRRKARQGDVPLETVVADLAAPASQTKWLEVRDLVGALGKLSPEQREVVLLVGLEGMSYLEAANVLDVPIGTVMSRLSRGRETLRHLTNHGTPPKLRVVK